MNTNTGLVPPAIQNGAGIDFFSMLMTQVTPTEGQYYPPADGNWYLGIPPLVYVDTNSAASAMFVNTNNNLLGVGWLYRTGYKYKLADTNGNVSLDFDTTKQDLIAYSSPMTRCFLQASGLVVAGAYSFQVPSNASFGDKDFIQIGGPLATSDGVGAPGSSIYIAPPSASQAVTVGSARLSSGRRGPRSIGSTPVISATPIGQLGRDAGLSIGHSSGEMSAGEIPTCIWRWIHPAALAPWMV